MIRTCPPPRRGEKGAWICLAEGVRGEECSVTPCSNPASPESLQRDVENLNDCEREPEPPDILIIVRSTPTRRGGRRSTKKKKAKQDCHIAFFSF